MLLDHLRAAAERAAWRILAGDMLAAGDDDAPPAPPPLTLAELHALESGSGITLPELAAEAAVLDRLAVLTAQLGSPWEAARHLFAPDAPCASLRATQTSEQGHPSVSYPPRPHEGSQAKSAPRTTPT